MKYIQVLHFFAISSLSFVSYGEAATIDKFLQIQPIQVCDNSGANCASTPLSQAHTELVSQQAGVAAVYLPTRQINDSSLLVIDSVTDVNLPGNGQSTNALTINTWFVDRMRSSVGTLFGEAYVGGNGVAINASAVTAANRTDTVVHEIGHNLGLRHNNFGAGGADNLMTRGSDRNAPASGLTQAQIDQIRSSPFAQDVPQVSVDLRGSTPFQAADFFDVTFDAGAAGISLSKLTLDLAPVNAFFDPTNAPPGLSGSPLEFGRLDGVSQSDITVSGMFDGSQFLSLSFVEDTFTAGDRISFGSDVDLFSNIDGFGATPEELIGMRIGMEFNIGLSLITELGTDLLTTSLSIAELTSFLGIPTPFGPQVPPGQIGLVGPIDHPDPVVMNPIPLPPALFMMLAALIAMAGLARRPARMV